MKTFIISLKREGETLKKRTSARKLRVEALNGADDRT